MAGLGHLIKQRRVALGMTQEQLGSKVGLSSQLISNIERGHRKVDLRHAEAFSTVLGIPFVEFLGGAGLPVDAYPAEAMVRLPVIAQVRAGQPRLAIEEYEETAPVNPDDIRGGEYFWMRVDGDSMIGTPGLHPGALVLVRRQPCVDNGQVAVIDIDDDGVVLKRVHHTNGRLVLFSSNPAYPPITIDANRCRVIGRAMKHYGDIL